MKLSATNSNKLGRSFNYVLSILSLCLISIGLNGQTTYPTPGLTLPAGKTIVISYSVDVNANVCPTGTLPSDISNQSNVTFGPGLNTVQTDDPDTGAAGDPTKTQVAGLTLGNLVYKDNNKNGSFDGGDAGIDGVLVRLYADDGDGVLDAGDGAALGTATTAGGGLYSFSPVCPGNYIVEVAASNFNMGGPLYDNTLMAALISSPTSGAPDPDNDVNNDDNGDPVAGFGVASAAITLTLGGEPINDGDTDNNTNLSLDLGFKTPTQVTINDVALSEGTGAGPTSFNFTVTRTDNLEAFSLTVNTGDLTAASPSDFTAISGGTVSFTAGGSTTATVSVLVNHDNVVEANETFNVLLSGAPAGVVITDGTGLGTITNDDAATLTLSGGIAQAEANAGTTSYTFTATLNNPVQGGFTANYQTVNGTATTADNDYNNFTGNQVFAGTAGENYTFNVTSNGDTKVELDETFTVGATLSGAPAGVTVAGSPQTATITNDDVAVVSISGNVSGSEASSPQAFSVTLSNAVDAPVTVLFNTSNGTATTADLDYNAVTNQTVTFPANITTPQTVNVTINNDNKVEANEVYNVSIGTLNAGGRNVSLGTTSGTGTITNDDAATVTLTGGGGSITEGNSGTTARIFTATLSTPVQGGFTVPYSTNDDVATTADNDYVDNDGSLSFTGTLNETKMITVLINGDFKVELNEEYNVTLNSIVGAPAGVTIGSGAQQDIINNDERDYGDAPSSYGTLIANNGANHPALFGFYLGSSIDGDPDGQPNATASGDDTDAEGDDDDGVTLPAFLIAGQTANITVVSSAIGVLDGWVDFNNNGVFDVSENIIDNTPLVAGSNSLSFAVPAGATVSNTFARFRLSDAGVLNPVGSGATKGEVEDYQVNIIANQFSISSPSVIEGNSGTINLVYTVTRTTNSTNDAVDYAITGGSATAGSDYMPLMSGTLNFPMGGALSQTITVVVNGDVVVEDNQTVVITLSNPVNGGIGTGTGTGTITNDDNATLTLSGGTGQTEGTTFTFLVNLSAAVEGGFNINYTTNNGTATGGSDYTDNDASKAFAGTPNETQSIQVVSTVDNIVELNETFNVALTTFSGLSAVQIAAITIMGSPQISTINNDDGANVSIAADISTLESAGPHNYIITLDNQVDVPVSVQFSTTNNTASSADNDFNGITNQLVTFPANSTANQSVIVTINNDNKVEIDEVYNVDIHNLQASGRNVDFNVSTRDGYILNDDAATVTLTGGGSANEGNSGTNNRIFTATLSAPVQGGLTVNYSSHDGTATLADLDYQINAGTLTFAGTLGETQNITMVVNGDNKVEADETFTVTLDAINDAPPSGLSIVGSPQTATLTNDEIDFGDAPDSYSTFLGVNGARHNTVLGFRLGATIDGEPDGQPNAGATGDGSDEDGVTLPGVLVTGVTSNVTVNASAAGKLDAWVDFNNNGSFADAGEKVFNNVSLVSGNNILSIATPAGALPSNTYARFRFSTVGGLSFNGAAADGEVEDYAIQIVNNQFSISSPTVTEGNAGTTNLTFVISRSTNANTSSVEYAITGGSASSGSDYVSIPGATLNFPAGGALSQNVSVTVNGDFVIEAHETIIMTLSNAVNGGIASGTGTGTITNDDSGTLTLSGGTSQSESNAGTVSYTFTVISSAAVQGGFQVTYTTNDGTAFFADNDYQDNDGALIFAGLAGETKTFTVLVNGDNKVELNEFFQVNLVGISATTATQAMAIAPSGSPQTGTITNDDAAVVSIAGNVSQPENLTPQVFTITLSNPVDVNTTVIFNTSDVSATTADNDYNSITNQTVTFNAGTTSSQTVNVTIVNDSKVEENEIYNVSIGSLNASGRNVSLGTSTGTGTIVNEDAANIILTGGTSLNEGNGVNTAFIFTATLNNPVQGGLTVAYTTNNGTATTADNDYTDNDGTLSFTGTTGEAKAITVFVPGDFKVEANETFTVALGTVTAQTGTQTSAITVIGSPQTSTIINDEVDYGDAPNTYPTLLANNGPRHNASLSLFLGTSIDGDPDGVPGVNANGDDTDAEGDDEDGVTMPNPLVTNTTATVTVNASAAGKLDAWVDFNNNGSFADAGEKVFNNVALVSGNNSLSFAVPNGATPSNSFARFRFSSAGGLSFNGAAADGEVEDYAVQIVNTLYTINDPAVNEGNAGTSNLTFTVTRSTNASATSVDYAITGGTATTADNDYQPLAAGTLNFTAGGSLTAPITVVVNGDVKVELNETVDITLSNPVNASIQDGSGTGTITNDDAATITITNPSLNEPDAGTQNMTFDVTMSNPSDANVSFNYSSVDGTATVANNDYTTTSGTHTLTPGQTTKQILVPIIGDCVIEPNEIFTMILSTLNNNGRAITFSGGGSTLTGIGTINNEDFPPVITCPANVTISCEVNPIPANTGGSATATDDCPGTPTITFTDVITNGSCVNNYTITRTWKATDGTNDMSTCTQTILVRDITPPTITCPAPQTVSCAALVPAPNTASVTTSDNCGGVITVIHVGDVISNQTCANKYTITRTYRATDVCGNSATCNQIITVNDITPPTITCPAPVTVSCAALVPAVNTASVSAGDNCAGAVTITFVSDVITNQTCANRYTLTRTYRATDVCGNSATCAQIITVNDVTVPTITCPVAQTFACSQQVPAPNPASVSASDNCAGAVTVTFVNDAISNQVCTNNFTLTRTYRATDVCGNSSTCTQVITVLDQIPPVINGVPTNVTIECTSPIPPVPNVTASDLCAGTVTLTFNEVSNQSPWETLCAYMSYNITRTWVATDACGNKTTKIQTISVADTQPPFFKYTPPQYITVECDEDNANNDNPVPVDACDATPAMLQDIEYEFSPSGCKYDYLVINTWTAGDNCGNIIKFKQYITVKDTTAPILFCPKNIVITSNDPVPVTWTAPQANDFCQGKVNVIQVSGPANGSIFAPNTVTNIVYQTTDECGNKATCSFTVSIIGKGGNKGPGISGKIKTVKDQDLVNVDVNLTGDLTQQIIGSQFNFENLPVGANLEVTPSKVDGPLNGVNTLDMVQLTNHILGKKGLDSPFKMLAADVNNSKTLTTADLVKIRQLILHITDKFEDVDSWEFLPVSTSFVDPFNPWKNALLSSLKFNNIQTDQIADFTAFKMGDINWDAVANANGKLEVKSSHTSILNAPDQSFEKGDNVNLVVTAKSLKDLLGLQFTMEYDKSVLDLHEIKGLRNDIGEDNFGLRYITEGKITASINFDESIGDQLFTVNFKAKEAGELSKLIRLSSALTTSEAYTRDSEATGLQLNFTKDGKDVIATEPILLQNEPNPFENTTLISFILPKEQEATISIFDVDGKLLREYKEVYQKGRNEINVNKEDLLSSGAYYYQLKTIDYVDVKKMIHVR